MVKTLIAFVFLSFAIQSDYRSVHNTSFKSGEKYEFKVKYGFLTIGQANVTVDPILYSLNNRHCYKIDVVGKTAGLTSLWKVRNTYSSYVDTSAMVPHKFAYSARENDYRRDQSMIFDHHKNQVHKTEKDKTKSFNVPDNTLDVVSGYYFLRTLDYSKIQIGGTVSAPLFFDEDLYMMKIKYAGKGKVKTKFGTINVIKLNPILPKNDMFKDENGIRIWVSDDANHVPIRIEADFKVSTINLELKEYSGNRHPFHWQ
ncbi:MAG: DUF3108 domain-containing protein [Leadbetterella sp.]